MLCVMCQDNGETEDKQNNDTNEEEANEEDFYKHQHILVTNRCVDEYSKFSV